MSSRCIIYPPRYFYQNKKVPVSIPSSWKQYSYTRSAETYINLAAVDAKKVINYFLRNQYLPIWHIKIGFSPLLDISNLRKTIISVLGGLKYREQHGVLILEPNDGPGIHGHLLLHSKANQNALEALLGGLRASHKGKIAFRVFGDARTHIRATVRYALKCKGLYPGEEGDRWFSKRRFFLPKFKFRKIRWIK